jgi:surfactin family lipopeptide synthetase C
MQATPATWKLLLAAGWQGSRHLKIFCGGEALDGNLAQQLLERSLVVWNLYGPTETTIWSSVYRVEFGGRDFEFGTENISCTDALATELGNDMTTELPNSDLRLPNSIPIGYPIANTQFYVLDDYLQQLPVGVPGQLYIGGASLARGYLNRPELTAQKFIPNPFVNSEYLLHRRSCNGIRNSENDQSNQLGILTNDFRTLYKTGDLVRYRPDGTLDYLGRIDDQVKLRGFRIELGEIEAALMQHPQVQQAVVILDKNQQDERLIAYLVMEPSAAVSTISTTELRRFLETKIPAYMLPSAYVMLEKLPLTPNGKIDRKALPTPEGTRPDLEISYVVPKTKVEQAIAQIWQQVLQVEKIGVHDNFFELGGHSLLMVKVHSKLREQFASDISLVEMFRYPTISALSAYFSRAGDDSDLSQEVDSRNEQVAAGKERLRQRLQQKTEVRNQN